MAHNNTSHPPLSVVNQTENVSYDAIEDDLVRPIQRSQIEEAETDPHVVPVDLAFPSDVDGAEGGMPYIDFKIEQYDGSQFTESKGGLKEVETLINAAGQDDALGEALTVFGINAPKAASAGITEGKKIINQAKEFAMSFLGGASNLAGSPSTAATGKMALGTTTNKGNIRLYLPHSIQEQFAATWTEEDINLSGAIAQGGIDALTDVVRHFDQEAKRFMGGLGGKAMGNPALQNVLLRQDGVAVNNHLEAFFKGVGFRKFTYTFQMNPRTQGEAIAIQNIVRKFKSSASPELATPGEYYGRFFKYPNQFQIKYWNGEETHFVSTCVLESLSVNYSAGQSNMTFRDKRPLQTDLSLNFKELEVMHKRKFEEEGY